MRMAEWWHRGRWLLRPIFVPLMYIHWRLNQLFDFREHPPWFWMVWCLLWPIMAAHIGHWAGPRLFPHMLGPITWIRNWIWNPLTPVTARQMADIGWWLGLFWGVIDCSFQSATAQFEEQWNPQAAWLEAPAGGLYRPIGEVAAWLIGLYIDFGPFIGSSMVLFALGGTWALIHFSVAWADAHQWPVWAGHGFLVIASLLFGPIVGGLLGMAMPMWMVALFVPNPPKAQPKPAVDSQKAHPTPPPTPSPNPPRPPDGRIRL